jgi:hypothetical protein
MDDVSLHLEFEPLGGGQHGNQTQHPGKTARAPAREPCQESIAVTAQDHGSGPRTSRAALVQEMVSRCRRADE